MVHLVNVFALLAVVQHAGWYGGDASVASTWLVSPRCTSTFLVGTLLMCLGAAIRAAAYEYLGRHFTFRLAYAKDQKLVTSGPYAIVRHPSYLGGVIAFFGIALAQLGPGSIFDQLCLWRSPLLAALGAFECILVISLCAWTVFDRMPKEDRDMQLHFKDEWERWAKRTPHKILPYIY